MDILSMIIAASVLTVTAISVVIFKVYMWRKNRKFSMLRIKMFGGCPLTRKEYKFLDRNAGRALKPTRIKGKGKPLTREGIKETLRTFANKLNPWYSQQEQLKVMGAEVLRSSKTISHLRDDLANLKVVIDGLTPKEKVSIPEYIKTKQQAEQKNESKSALDIVDKVGYSSFL